MSDYSDDEHDNANNDKVMQRIAQLSRMVEIGALKKEDLPGLIKAIYLGKANGNKTRPNKGRNNGSNSSRKWFPKKAKIYRRPATPETEHIRRLVEGPIERRFTIQAADERSPLWKPNPPRRLNEPLFQTACTSPLDEIYTQHALELKDIPSAKVVSVCKWKLRKMRANLLQRGLSEEDLQYWDDGYNWKRAIDNCNSRVFRPVIVVDRGNSNSRRCDDNLTRTNSRSKINREHGDGNDIPTSSRSDSNSGRSEGNLLRTNSYSSINSAQSDGNLTRTSSIGSTDRLAVPRTPNMNTNPSNNSTTSTPTSHRSAFKNVFTKRDIVWTIFPGDSDGAWQRVQIVAVRHFTRTVHYKVKFQDGKTRSVKAHMLHHRKPKQQAASMPPGT